MKTAEEITARLQALEQAKAVLLQPHQVFVPETMKWDAVANPLPVGALESLNAQIAVLSWVLRHTSVD